MGDAWSDMWAYLGSDAAWTGRNGLPSLLWAHVQLSLAALVVAALVAIPPAAVLGHTRRGALLAVSVVNIGRAIPSFAVIALVLPFSLRWGFGLGFWPTMVALVLLAVPPIFTNTYTGVRDVPADAVEAARGMGMRPRELVTRVEMPVALPLVLTGLRVSASQVVATATLGALVGYRCLGTPIIAGFQRQDKGALLAAAILVALLALVTDGLFALAGRWLVPWRSRKSGRAADVTVAAAP
ncbi:MAG TPA: ABC transporter permease [Acidimicrobiales bacterium]